MIQLSTLEAVSESLLDSGIGFKVIEFSLFGFIDSISCSGFPVVTPLCIFEIKFIDRNAMLPIFNRGLRN
jgi:hypothetical protein